MEQVWVAEQLLADPPTEMPIRLSLSNLWLPSPNHLTLSPTHRGLFWASRASIACMLHLLVPMARCSFPVELSTSIVCRLLYRHNSRLLSGVV